MTSAHGRSTRAADRKGSLPQFRDRHQRPNEPPYQVLRTQENKDCRKAVAGEIAKLLTELGCSQVVRGTLRAPNSAYLVTAGVFNLRDIAAAETAHEKIKPLVNNKKGRFQGMVAGEGTDAIALSSAQVGWHIRGHYLVYCVIARADGEPVTDVDPYARQILYDMIELHLRGDVLEKRATVPVDEASPVPRVLLLTRTHRARTHGSARRPHPAALRPKARCGRLRPRWARAADGSAPPAGRTPPDRSG